MAIAEDYLPEEEAVSYEFKDGCLLVWAPVDEESIVHPAFIGQALELLIGHTHVDVPWRDIAESVAEGFVNIVCYLCCEDHKDGVIEDLIRELEAKI